MGSSQPNKETKPRITAAQPSSAYLEVLQGVSWLFCVFDVVEVADNLGQDLPKLHGIRRLKAL